MVSKKMLIAMAALVLVLGAALAIILPRLTAPDDDPKPTEASLTIVDRNVADIKRVFISNANGEYEISVGKEVLIEGLAADILDQNTVAQLLRNCAAIRPRRIVADNLASAGLYGLENPAAHVSVEFVDGDCVELYLGSAGTGTADVYCKVAGEESIYLLSKETTEQMLLPVESYISKRITPECPSGTSLGAIADISISGEMFATPISIYSIDKNEASQIEAISFGVVTHIIEGPGVCHELDRTYAISVFDSLFDIVAEEAVAFGCDAAELAEYGFDKPDVTVNFTIKNGSSTVPKAYSLMACKDTDGSWLAICNENGVIYRISERLFMSAQYEQLVMRWFLSPLLLDVSEVHVETGKELYKFILSDANNENFSVSMNGQSIDTGSFRTYYQLLTSAAGTGEYAPNEQISDEPVVRITYLYNDRRKPNDVLELYAADTRKLLVSINGVSEFKMRSKFADVLLSATVALLKENTFDISW